MEVGTFKEKNQNFFSYKQSSNLLAITTLIARILLKCLKSLFTAKNERTALQIVELHRIQLRSKWAQINVIDNFQTEIRMWVLVSYGVDVFVKVYN